jgi:hypothetical protein
MSLSFPHCLAITYNNLVEHLSFEFVRVPAQHLRAEGLGLPFTRTLDLLVQRMANKPQNALFSDILDALDTLRHGPRDITEAEIFHPYDCCYAAQPIFPRRREAA